MSARQIASAMVKLQDKIRERVELETGFASQNVQFRHLLQLLRFYDKSGSGSISFPNFQEFILRMNCMSGLRTRDIEFLFFRHDHSVVGFIDCKEFAEQIYGVGPYPNLSLEQLEVIEKVRLVLAKQDVDAPAQFAWDLKENSDSSGFVSISRCVQRIYSRLDQKLSQKALFHLLEPFNHNDQVDVMKFLRSVQFGMSPDRKKLVRLLYETLDVFQQGTVLSSQLRTCYVPSDHSHVIKFRGSIYPAPSYEQLLWMIKGTHNGPKDVEVSFEEFLDYYSNLSITLQDDDFFDFVLRSSWSIESKNMKTFDFGDLENKLRHSPFLDSLNSSSGASLKSPSSSSTPSLWTSGDDRLKSPKKAIHRRVIVSHSDDSEEAVDLIDEMGKTALDPDSIYRQVLDRGVRDISRINY